MFKISVYGKGGVGKSSVSSNLSHLISKRGKKVLHVGCDPKHDSTRLLTNGISQKTFMDSLLDGTEEGVIEKGSDGISCVECGGAEPGIGCAGKGMISLFNFLERNTPADTDVRVCDVLGDVVCGGFSVPMRRKQTDGIILVVSEDFMSVYAANNILRGIRNLNGTPCIIGMVLNSRTPEDRIRVEEFSKATGIPVLGIIEKCNLFSDAEAQGHTVSELFPESESFRQLSEVADKVMDVIEGRAKKVKACPLNENAMTQIAAKMQVTDFEPPEVRLRSHFDHVDRARGVVYKGDVAMPACTSHGAVEVLLSVKDAAIVLHGPRNCAFLMEYAWLRRSQLMRSVRGEDLPDNLYSTGMNASNVFTGDRSILRDTVRRALDDGFKTVFIVLTCTPDTIGTDVSSIISEFDGCGARIIEVKPDDYFLGSKFGAMAGGFDALSELIDWKLPVERGKVGIISFEPNALADRSNVAVIEEILKAFNLHLGTIFTDNITCEEVRTLSTCQYFISLGYGPMTKLIERPVVEHGRKTVSMQLPHMLAGIREWCEGLELLTGDIFTGQSYYESKVREFENAISDIRDKYKGCKAVFYHRKVGHIIPNIEVLEYLGIESVALLGMPQKFDYPSRPEKYDDHLPLREDVELCHVAENMDELGASIVVSSDPRTGRIGRPWIGMVPRYLGVRGSIEWVRKVDNCMSAKPIQKWKVRN